jgi:hypothetical protein
LPPGAAPQPLIKGQVLASHTLGIKADHSGSAAIVTGDLANPFHSLSHLLFGSDDKSCSALFHHLGQSARAEGNYRRSGSRRFHSYKRTGFGDGTRGEKTFCSREQIRFLMETHGSDVLTPFIEQRLNPFIEICLMRGERMDRTGNY